MPSQATLDALPLTLNGLQALSPNPQSPAFAAAGFQQAITALMPIGNSTYNGLAVQMTRRFQHGLQFIGAYTWSHNIDDSTAAFFTTVLTPRRPMDFGDTGEDRASSALDRRQRLTLSGLWELPWFAHANSWWKKNLAGKLAVCWHLHGRDRRNGDGAERYRFQPQRRFRRRPDGGQSRG